MNQRLRPEQRIRNRQTFQTIFEKGVCVRGSLLNLWTYEQPEASRSQKVLFAPVVSKKTDLRANRRNLWKRRLKEAFRRNQLRFRKGVWILAQSRKQTQIPSYREMEAELIKLGTRAGIIK
jgi:ribonuclease P protein component